MSRLPFITFFSLFYAVSISNVTAQICDSISLDSTQKKLYLNGSNFTLIDNALRCFKLNSIAGVKDSLVRIWMLDDNYPDSPLLWRVKMFEFGKNEKVPKATLNLLEWSYETDSSLPVKCIKRMSVSPNRGWLAFERDVRGLHLPTLYQRPFINRGQITVDYGMFIIQYLFGHTTYTVDFTGLWSLSSPINALHSEHAKRVTYLIWYVEKHFSVKLSIDAKGRDFLDDNMKKLNFKR